MLKIKDEVDLKELEKFGFQKDEYGYFFKNDYDVVVLRIYIDTRKISNRGDRLGNIVLYDLIQEGLVEKVEG